MKTFKLFSLGLVFTLILILISTTAVAKQNDYSVSWIGISSGGMSSGGDFTMSAAIAQPEVSTALSGGGFTMAGGVWGSPVTTRFTYFLPNQLK
jgi:hypothetical protein